MKKNPGTRTATTFTLLLGFPADQREGLTGTYTWPTEARARETIEMMVEINGFEHTEHFAPGLEVHAFYVNGELATVIEIADDTAARLHTAVRRERPVTVTYTKADGTETIRTIEPTALALTKAGDVIVKAADRASGERRSFRLDRVSAYTVHRTRFTVRLEAPAPSKAELAEAFKAGSRAAEEEIKPYAAPHVRVTGRGWTGHLVPGTRAFGPTGWSAKVELDPEFAHLAPSGTVRVSDTELTLV